MSISRGLGRERQASRHRWSSLRDYYLLLAVRGHLLLELGRREEAADCLHAALECRCSDPEAPFPAPQTGAV